MLLFSFLILFFAGFAILVYIAFVVSIQHFESTVAATGKSSIRVNVSSSNVTTYYCSWCRCKDSIRDKVVNCSYLGLFRTPVNIDPKISVLDIRHNRVVSLMNSSFNGQVKLKELVLTMNRISRIETGTFDCLHSLHVLDLSFNKLHVLQNVLRPGMFSKLQKLTHLYLQGNVNQPNHAFQGVPESPIVELLALESLTIDGVINAVFGPGYNNLTKLTNMSMSGTDGFCRIKHLSRNSFQNLPALKYLALGDCDIKHIDYDTFYYVKHLVYLDLSWNFDLEFDGFGKAAHGLKYTEVRELKINAIHNPYRAGTEILRENMRHVRDLKLERLYMDDNGIEYVDYGVSSMFPASLKLLTLRRNRLNFGIYLEELIYYNPGLVILDAGKQEVAVRSDSVSFSSVIKRRKERAIDPLQGENMNGRAIAKRSFFSQIFYEDRNEFTSLALQSLICSGSRSDFHLMNFSRIPNNITILDMSDNFIPVSRENAFDGLHKLQVLNLSNNYVEHVQRNAFRGLENLKTLDLSNNLLGFEVISNSQANMFIHFRHLKHLNLTNNRIVRIQRLIFESLVNLVSLNLSYNHLEHFEVNLVQMTALETLDLSENKIQFLSDNMRFSLDVIGLNQILKLNLARNRLLCNCETQPFLKWLMITQIQIIEFDSYYCSLSNGSLGFLNTSSEILEHLHSECRSYLHVSIGGSAGGTFLLSFLVFYLTYKNRWKLRYMYYMAKIKLDLPKKFSDSKQCQGQEFAFDAFVSYADGDRHFVIDDMIKHLEDTPGLRLMIRDRDYEIGEAIAVNILRSIHYSRKTVFLLSHRFLRNKWCNFELNMALMESVHTKREVILLIFLETIPPNKLPLTITSLLRGCPFLEWPKSKNAQNVFWDKCIKLLNKN